MGPLAFVWYSARLVIYVVVGVPVLVFGICLFVVLVGGGAHDPSPPTTVAQWLDSQATSDYVIRHSTDKPLTRSDLSDYANRRL
jgi:hypothetical protein